MGPSRCIPADIWQRPPTNLYKCSVDGSFNSQSKTSGIGGIVRDHNGTLIQAFASATSAGSAIEAEIQALMRGAHLCLEMGIQEVIFEGDSSLVCHSLTSDLGIPWKLMLLWKKLRDALAKFNRWQVTLACRNENRLADALAKLGPPQDTLFTASFPIHIKDIYSQELYVQEDRLVNPEDQRKSTTLDLNTAILRSQLPDATDACFQEPTNLGYISCNDNGPLSHPFVSNIVSI